MLTLSCWHAVTFSLSISPSDPCFFFISIQLVIIKLDYLQVTLLFGHSVKWLKSGKIQNMLRYPSWTSMHHVLVSVCIARAWEHLDRWLASHRAGPGSVYVGLMLDLCFHHFRRETECELFYEMTGNLVMMSIDYLQHPLSYLWVISQNLIGNESEWRREKVKVPVW